LVSALPARIEAPPGPVGKPERRLSDELRLLDEAHAALGSGDTASCLSLLDQHDRDFPTPALAAEALALRVEAQARRGDRAAAARLASQFLAAYGDRPEAQRVRSVLDAAQRDTNP
jgi:outer membrane protein assembly factor BamD (BamD/ComL family)